ALTTLHRPPEPADATPESRAWSRLAYDELLASQLALALVRAHLRRPGGRRGAGEHTAGPTTGNATGAGSPSPPLGGEGLGEEGVQQGQSRRSDEGVAADRTSESAETSRQASTRGTPPSSHPSPPKGGEGAGSDELQLSAPHVRGTQSDRR